MANVTNQRFPNTRRQIGSAAAEASSCARALTRQLCYAPDAALNCPRQFTATGKQHDTAIPKRFKTRTRDDFRPRLTGLLNQNPVFRQFPEDKKFAVAERDDAGERSFRKSFPFRP